MSPLEALCGPATWTTSCSACAATAVSIFDPRASAATAGRELFFMVDGRASSRGDAAAVDVPVARLARLIGAESCGNGATGEGGGVAALLGAAEISVNCGNFGESGEVDEIEAGDAVESVEIGDPECGEVGERRSGAIESVEVGGTGTVGEIEDTCEVDDVRPTCRSRPGYALGSDARAADSRTDLTPLGSFEEVTAGPSLRSCPMACPIDCPMALPRAAPTTGFDSGCDGGASKRAALARRAGARCSPLPVGTSPSTSGIAAATG